MRLMIAACFVFWCLAAKSAGFRFAAAKKRQMRQKRLATIAKKKEDEKKSRSVLADILDEYEEYGGDEESESDEDRERREYEASVLREVERDMKYQNQSLHSIIVNEIQGIRPSEALKEEYRSIPSAYKRNDGFPGDVVADYLSGNYPEFGIETERDLLDYFSEEFGYGIGRAA